MLTHTENPAFDAMVFRISDRPRTTQNFMKSFMDSPAGAAAQENPEGAPGIFVYDSSRPLNGLGPFGFEGAAALEELYQQPTKNGIWPRELPSGLEPDKEHTFEHANDFHGLQDGDLLVVQARKSGLHSGGSTALGRMRLALHAAAVEQGFMDELKGFAARWIVDFPMFTPNNESDAGQGGSAGFSATHHPFTAPKTFEDVQLMRTDPLKAVADHYDLVINGVELGGGSRRIHNAAVQQYVMRDVLKVCYFLEYLQWWRYTNISN